MRLTLFLIAMLITAPNIAEGQTEINSLDSVDIKNKIEAFFSWCIDVIKNEKSSDKSFSPQFVRRKDGMTTLDFVAYQKGLRKHKFTESFIRRKTNEYKPCTDNLSKIPFEKFSAIKDLAGFEKINCDFGNRYEWTFGQEPIDRATLSRLKILDKNTIFGYVDFTIQDRLYGQAIVTFKKIKKEWMVEDVKQAQ